MNFRTKLLILLLTITLLPLGLSFLSQRSLVVHFGNKLADDTHALLNSNAVNMLHLLVDDYGRILRRDDAMARFALKAQAEAAVRLLSATPLPTGQSIFLADDFDDPLRQPADLSPSERHLRVDADGTLTPMQVSWSEQVFFLARGTEQEAVAEQLQRLGGMADVYRTLQQINPALFLWQYTALESGIHSSYPGKGGYPASYDPRQRQWYTDAVANERPVQRILTDLTTGTLILTLSQPIYAPNGELYGVTAVDIDYRQLFHDWNIPHEWADVTNSMVLRFDQESEDATRQLEVLLENNLDNASRHWSLPVEREYIDLTDPQLEVIAEDLRQGISAVRKITYQGEETLWAYGSRYLDAPFPLVILPYQRIIAPAAQAQQSVNQQIALGLSFSALLTVIVLLVVIVVALRTARRVTDPITQLATAAEQLSQGHFDARVDIRTGDELEHLGEVFNGLGCRLEERKQMLQSLALAKEIQQQLLPLKTPERVNFELAGASIYCDETGGDYYDFIPLGAAGGQPLGLVVGDVSGHGIGAALVMATTRGMLHALAEHYTTSLPQLCAEINRHLSHAIADSSFMTLFFGHLNPEQRTLDWVSAGQAPLFLYRRGGGVEQLHSSGIPLGILASADYDLEETIHFKPGDILLVGTDGLWETQNGAGEMFGTERLCRILTEHSTAPVSQITAEIFTELDRFRGEHPFTDDLTLMLVKAR
ncbi:MAG: SpoIIE family protein phosphatase [Pelovirga sp.]